MNSALRATIRVGHDVGTHAISDIIGEAVGLLPMLDFEVQRFTRQCCQTDEVLQPGDTFYSVLVTERRSGGSQGLFREVMARSSGRSRRVVEVAGAGYPCHEDALGTQRRDSALL